MAYTYQKFHKTLFQGLAPTVSVARIALTSDNTEVATTQLIILQFQGQSTHQTTRNGVNNVSIPVAGKEESIQEVEIGTA